MRISMSLPKKLLADFDEVLKQRGYQSRSKGIRDALQDYIVRYQWMNSMEGERIGIITIIYKNRKTQYDLITVKKGNRLINMDSQAPNKVVGEYLPRWIEDVVCIRPEKKYKNSRFDFYVETKKEKIFIEVKGVTLEMDGVVRFPDAPTLRGIKHIKELEECIENGYQAYIIFVIQMENVSYFEPNWETQPEFGEELKQAQRAGVKIVCLDCKVAPDELVINQMVEYKL